MINKAPEMLYLTIFDDLLKKNSIFSKFLPAKQKYIQITLKLYRFIISKDFTFSMLKTYKTNFKKEEPYFN